MRMRKAWRVLDKVGHVEPERENDLNVGNGMGVCWKTVDRTD